MGVDSYWQVPDGLDYYWETELHHNREGHIIQPFTSLSITHLIPSTAHPPASSPPTPRSEPAAMRHN